MKKHRLLFLYMLAVLTGLLIAGNMRAQSITYCTDLAERKMYFFSNDYIAGKQDDNVFIWHADAFEKHALVLNICNDGMHLLKKVSFKLNQSVLPWRISFFQKNNSNQVLLMYLEKNELITQLYNYDAESSTIIPGLVIGRDDKNKFAQPTIKYSADGKYTGIIQGFRTTEDSTLVRYSLYDDQSHLVRSIDLVLPHQHNLFDFGTSVIDKAGNLVFYTLNTNDDTASGQAMTMYQINLEKDSLLTNGFFKNGFYSDVQVQQNKTNGNITVSGIFSDGSSDSKTNTGSQAAYFFIIPLNHDLSQVSSMTLFSVDKIMDSLYPANSRINSLNLVLNKDSGYNIYFAGLTGYNVKFKEGTTGRSYIPPPDMTLYKNYSISNTVQLASNIPNIYLGNGGSSAPAPSGDNNNAYPPSSMQWLTSHVSGQNFFTVVSVAKNNILSVRNLVGEIQDASVPQLEYVVNTENNIHYIFTRVTKNNKQIVADIAVEGSKPIHQVPVLANPKFTLLLDQSMQISSHTLLIPFLKVNGLSFAKMELE